MIRFGWSRQNPPDFRLRLFRHDLQAGANRPASHFVARVGGLMAGDADDIPRCAVIENLLPLLERPQQVRQFQIDLTQAVSDWLFRHHPQFFSPPVGHKLNHTLMYRPMAKPLTLLHQDVGTLETLTYGVNRNVLGGKPVLVDVRQYCRDGNLPIPLSGKADELPKDALKHYTLDVSDLDLENDMALVLMNNTPGGIFHAGETIAPKDPMQPLQRPLGVYRISHWPWYKWENSNWTRTVANFIRGA